jgi:hypothetical protein
MVRQQVRFQPQNLLRIVAVGGIVVSCLTTSLRSSAGVGPQSKTGDKAPSLQKYKEYHNDRFNFSFRYPEPWLINEALNGGGVEIALKHGPDLPRISVSGTVVQADKAGHVLSLEEDFESGLASMRKWRPNANQHIENVVVAKKEVTKFQGLPAIAGSITYDMDGQGWIQEGIMFHSQDDKYSFGIWASCQTESVRVFLPVYDEIVRTFRLRGPPM